MTAEDLELAVLLKEAFQALEAEMLARAHAAGFKGLRASQVAILRELRADGMRTTDLARRAGVTRQAVAQVVAEAAELGYVEHVADPTDRRAKLVRFTPAGRRAARLAVELFQQQEAALRRQIGNDRMRQLKADLASIVDASAADKASPGPTGGTT